MIIIYDALYDDAVYKDIKKLNKDLFSKIATRIETYLVRDPLNLGKHLLGKFHGLYRYRYGDYRIVYEVIEREQLIRVISIKHRREVYE